MGNTKKKTFYFRSSIWIWHLLIRLKSRYLEVTIMGLHLFVFNMGIILFYQNAIWNIMVLFWISNFRQNWKKRNFLWAIRWRRRSFSWAAHNGFYHALIPLYCSQALLMCDLIKALKKLSIRFYCSFWPFFILACSKVFTHTPL